MKKALAASMLLLALLAAGCSGKAATLPEAETLLKDAVKAASGQKSYSVQAEALTTESGSEEGSIAIKQQVDVTHEPLGYRLRVDVDQGDKAPAIAIERIHTPEGSYMLANDTWSVLPDTEEQLAVMVEEAINAEHRAELLLGILDQLEVSREDEYFVLKGEVQGDAARELVMKLIQADQFPITGEEDNLQMSSVKIQLAVHSDTGLPKSLTAMLEPEGEERTMEFKEVYTYPKELTIEVPAEAAEQEQP